MTHQLYEERIGKESFDTAYYLYLINFTEPYRQYLCVMKNYSEKALK